MENKNAYPIYRKLSNDKSFYKISSDRIFEEIQRIGSRKVHYFHEAKQYPEILFIQDLINFAHQGIEDFTEKEWEIIMQ